MLGTRLYYSLVNNIINFSLIFFENAKIWLLVFSVWGVHFGVKGGGFQYMILNFADKQLYCLLEYLATIQILNTNT